MVVVVAERVVAVVAVALVAAAVAVAVVVVVVLVVVVVVVVVVAVVVVVVVVIVVGVVVVVVVVIVGVVGVVGVGIVREAVAARVVSGRWSRQVRIIAKMGIGWYRLGYRWEWCVNCRKQYVSCSPRESELRAAVYSPVCNRCCRKKAPYCRLLWERAGI